MFCNNTTTTTLHWRGKTDQTVQMGFSFKTFICYKLYYLFCFFYEPPCIRKPLAFMLIVDLDQTAMMLSSQNGSYFHHQDPWILGFANRDHGRLLYNCAHACADQNAWPKRLVFSPQCYLIIYVSQLQVCYEWFTKGIPDLDTETQSKLFQNELLRTDPSKITEMGKSVLCFTCI